MHEGELIVLSPQAYGVATQHLRFWDPIERRRERDEAMRAEGGSPSSGLPIAGASLFDSAEAQDAEQKGVESVS